MFLINIFASIFGGPMINQTFLFYLKNTFKDKKIITLSLLFYFIFCFISMINLFSNSYIVNGLFALLVCFVPLVIFLIEWLFKISIPPTLLIIFLFIPFGSLLGNSYEFYNIFPWFDDLLHTISGFIFACFGFTLTEIFVGKPDNKKKFVGCLLGGCVFSLAIVLIWELIEYAGTSVVGAVMQEDSIVNNIRSFFHSGSHKEAIEINDITQTIINYNNGNQYIIEGYLDIGLTDTLNDMLVCFLGALVYLIVLILGHFKFKNISQVICPKINYID